LRECFTLLLMADEFDGPGDFVEVPFQGSLEKRFFVGEILIQGSDGDTGSLRYSCRGELLLAHVEQNLNGCFENRIDACSRTSLNRQFTGL